MMDCCSNAKVPLDLRHALTAMTRPLIFLAVVMLLAACATVPPPPLTAASPASPEAPEGIRIARQTSLQADETTRKSHAMLSAAQKEQEQWDDYGPVSGTPDTAPKTGDQMEMKGMEMKHEH